MGIALFLATVPKARMAADFVRAKASGALPDVAWTDLLRLARNGAHLNLQEFANTQNPYSAIRNKYDSPEDIAAGGELFRSHCVDCHGSDGAGGPGGPALRGRRMTLGDSDWALFRTLSNGVPGTAMPASDLEWTDRWRLVAYVKTIAAEEHLVNEQTESFVHTQSVDYGAILAAGRDSTGWLTYSGSYDGHRFSNDMQITPTNVAGLRLLWERQYNTSEPSIETSPLVVGHFMFVTLPPNRVEALDAETGALIWAYDRKLPDHLSLCCGYVNRGLAVLGSTLFFGTLDAHVVALDMATGRVSWDVEIADYRAGYTITGAPLALKNLVITGVAGGEFGIRGFLDARDQATGKEVWRFYSIPETGQAGAETWSGHSWETGGGPTWLTGSFDPDSNQIYWPIGNPSPNFNVDARAGDNLYTNSVLALDADTGTLRWYFQFSPHDPFDWDATEIVVVLDGNSFGKPERLIAQANRNGFFYLLNARNGALLLAKPFATENWSEGVDSIGRPIMRQSAAPSEKGTAVYPGVGGATNWESPTFSPVTGLLYVPVLDWGGTFFKAHSGYRPGELFLGGSFQYLAAGTAQGAVRAIDPRNGQIKWEYRHPATNIGGLLSTAGGIVFGSLNRDFFALDAKTGRELWHLPTGGRIAAAPITFQCEGKQLVTIAAGHDVLTFGLQVF